MCGSDICVVLYICVVQICVVLIYVWFTICVVQIYVCVEGLDIVMRSASPHCVPAVPQPYFPFIFAKPPPLLNFHFIFATNTKKNIFIFKIKSLIFDTWTFVPTVNLLKLIHSVNFEQWPQIHPLFLPVVC